MSGLTLKMGYTVKDTQRYFSVRIAQNGKSLKANSFSIGRDRNEDEAYAAAVKTAKSLGETYGLSKSEIDNGIISKKHLIDAYTKKAESKKVKESSIKTEDHGKDKLKGDISLKSDQLVEYFGHLGKWKALINHAIKLHGLDKVKEVISSAGEMLAEAEASLAHERAVKNDAFRKIAEVVLGARNAGVEMGVQSPEVEEYVEILKRQALRQPKTQRYQGTYKLNNETWDGVGHMPASMAAWLREDESRDINDLKVA